MDHVATTTDLKLTCHPGKDGHKFVFDYTLHNLGQTDVYVMQATTSIDPSTRAARADDKVACVILDGQGDAIIGKFPAPLPTSQRAAMPVLPLAVRLAPGDILEERLEVAEPLAETSPYLPDLKLREYDVVDIDAVVFAIGYWVSGVEGIAAAPSPYAPGLYSMVTGGGGTGSAVVSQRFKTRGLQVFKRSVPVAQSLPN